MDENNINVNKKYKDTVFTLLFNNPDLLRELYGALEGVELPPDIPVTINTLEEVIFMQRKNDISFAIGDKLVVLIEHQSTINLNMALRMLMYVTRVYEKIIKDENIYKKGLVRLPRPYFFVLYNGTAPHPDEQILKLSDAFADATSIGLAENDIALELTVRVLNINHGKNAETVQRCKALAHYSAFVAKVQDYKNEGFSLEEAIKKAIHYCIDHDILKEFLRLNSTEVTNMTLEWDQATAEKVWREESIEEGIEIGIERGRGEAMEDIARNALVEGFSFEQIQRITGLEIDVIEQIQSQL